jgi:hypothetical protein
MRNAMENAVSKDGELTEEERRIIADIERHEFERRLRWPWPHLRARQAQLDVGAWAAVAVGAAVLAVGLLANLPVVPFAGFVILLAGTVRLSRRISASRLLSWLRRAGSAGSRPGPRGSRDSRDVT